MHCCLGLIFVAYAEVRRDLRVEPPAPSCQNGPDVVVQASDQDASSTPSIRDLFVTERPI